MIKKKRMATVANNNNPQTKEKKRKGSVFLQQVQEHAHILQIAGVSVGVILLLCLTIYGVRKYKGRAEPGKPFADLLAGQGSIAADTASVLTHLSQI